MGWHPGFLSNPKDTVELTFRCPAFGTYLKTTNQTPNMLGRLKIGLFFGLRSIGVHLCGLLRYLRKGKGGNENRGPRMASKITFPKSPKQSKPHFLFPGNIPSL